MVPMIYYTTYEIQVIKYKEFEVIQVLFKPASFSFIWFLKFFNTIQQQQWL